MNNFFQRIREENNRILVIGDIMLDEYVYGSIERISPEAPVPIMYNTAKKCYLGGAANVCYNIITMGGCADLVGEIGLDIDGEIIRELLKQYGISTKYIISSNKKTTRKTRYLSKAGQQILRIDSEDLAENPEIQNALCSLLKSILPKYKIIILSDYGKGFFDEGIVDFIFKHVREEKQQIIIDPKRWLKKYCRKAYLLKPNLDEFCSKYGKRITITEILRSSELILQTLNLDRLLITCGSDGMVYLEKLKDPYYIPAGATNVVNVSGAGDVVSAAIALGLIGGAEIRPVLCFASRVAAVMVKRPRADTLKIDDVVEILGHEYKVISDRSMLSFLRQYYWNKRIALTNGCFDIFHIGHVDFLEKAKQTCDILIVAVNNDESICKLKGKSRPVIHLDERIKMLELQPQINWIVTFSTEEELLQIIESLSPDILLKGIEYENRSITGKEYIESRGGEVKLIPRHYVQSTSLIVDRIIRSSCNEV